ncbi:MAG: fumarylacetoacetate hydrolase family protein [Chloroflexi bacterium]|nr:fumarylacetoacetate hydrolase family protein [Chloroflexota bacterium]
MRLVTYSQAGQFRTGVMLDDQNVVDLNRASGGRLPTSMLEFLAQGEAALAGAREALDAARSAAKSGASGSGLIISLGRDDVRLEAPIPRPGKVLAIGLNYRDHAEESGQALPAHPVVFSKVSTCITGPGAPVHRPKASAAVDWEAEMCFVIGRKARHIKAAEAMEYVAGFMCGNDVSVRDWQFHNPTWMIGKGFDTHGPIGPWLVTKDEVDPANLDVKCFVNGEQVQSSNTKHLIFDIQALIEYLSTAFTLEPGDVVFTGTPAGVGVSRKPPVFLKAGDVVRVEITGLGVLENPIVEEP